jgi:hypothetical protein
MHWLFHRWLSNPHHPRSYDVYGIEGVVIGLYLVLVCLLSVCVCVCVNDVLSCCQRFPGLEASYRCITRHLIS